MNNYAGFVSNHFFFIFRKNFAQNVDVLADHPVRVLKYIYLSYFCPFTFFFAFFKKLAKSFAVQAVFKNGCFNKAAADGRDEGFFSKH